MKKYNNERDFIQKEFMKDLDPTMFILTEDADNYYIVWIEKLENGTDNTHTFITLYKSEISKVMKEYEED